MFSAKRLLNKIKKFRKDNRINQAAFAKQAGVSATTLVNWERERSDFNPSLTQIVNIAKMFGVTPGELLLQGKDKYKFSDAADNSGDNSKTAAKRTPSKAKSSTQTKVASATSAKKPGRPRKASKA